MSSDLSLGTPFPILWHLLEGLQRCILRNVGRCRLRGGPYRGVLTHRLKIEAGKWLGSADLCDNCSCNEVQDEKPTLLSQSKLLVGSQTVLKTKLGLMWLLQG
eukprot:scaffold20701_cov19-Tisochrysis_lutea.AAC.1